MLPIQPIRAKLSIPRMPFDMVARPRLVERLNQGLTRQLTLVSAPAGYGKSTLISEWLKQLQMPSAWLTVDEGDDDLYPFLSYLVAAIRTSYPTFGQETVALLNARTLPVVQTLATTFLFDLETLDDSLVLVVDDLYRLTQLSIYEFLERLIAYLPSTVHLVLSTRSDPLLSLLSLRAHGQLSEVRQRELRFTPIETRTFVTQGSTTGVDLATTAALAERTDGWVVGLRLFLLSAQDEAGLARLAQGAALTDTDVAAYLVGEVMSKQTPAMQEFLLHLAIVERFSLSLCEGLFPQLSWQELEQMLAQMQRQNLFVIALGEGWYRYHPLLRDFLLHRLTRQGSAAEVSDLHRRAAGWYEKQGMVSEALFHLLQAPDEDLAIDLLARHRMEAMNFERWQQLEHWLSYFSPLMIEKHPLLAMTQAWLNHAHAQVYTYMGLLPEVERQIAEGVPPSNLPMKQMLEGEIHALHCEGIFTYEGGYAQVIAKGRRALALLPLTHSMGRATAYIYFVQALSCNGQHAEAQALLARGLEESGRFGDSFGPRLLLLKFQLDYLAMDMVAMREITNQERQLAEARGLTESILGAYYHHGIFGYISNDLETAYLYFEQMVAKRHVVHVGEAASSYVFLALIHQARGEAEKALEVIESALRFVRENADEPTVFATVVARALIFLLQGRTHDALAWVESLDNTLLDLVPRSTNMREAPLVLMKTLVSDGSKENIARAAALLPGMLETARTAHAHFLTAELLALRAKLCLNQADHEGALQALTEAVLLVQVARPLRLFGDLGLENSRSLIPLFEELKRRQVAPEYLAELLDLLAKFDSSRVLFSPLSNSVSNSLAIPSQTTVSHSSPQLAEALTARESEILALLAQGLSNRKIGEQLFLSAKTVENYTLSLYSKLRVKSRSQAVAKAREVGLIPQ